MKVLATGPESSGTRYLTRLLAAAGADVVHRSQPEGDDWIDLAAMLDDFDAVVVIVRGRLAHLRSYVGRRIVDTEAEAERKRRRALARLAPIMGHPKTIVVTFESLREDAERRHLLAALGLDVAASDVQKWGDANAKHYTSGPCSA